MDIHSEFRCSRHCKRIDRRHIFHDHHLQSRHSSSQPTWKYK